MDRTLQWRPKQAFYHKRRYVILDVYHIYFAFSTINDEAIDSLPEAPAEERMDDLTTLGEIQKAVHLLPSDKSPGFDTIPSEIYSEEGMAQIEKLHQLFLPIWQHEKKPQDFKDALVIHFYKKAKETKSVQPL